MRESSASVPNFYDLSDRESRHFLSSHTSNTCVLYLKGNRERRKKESRFLYNTYVHIDFKMFYLPVLGTKYSQFSLHFGFLRRIRAQ